MGKITAVLETINGVAAVYMIAVVNALLSLLFSFGVTITADQRSAIVAFVNAALVLVAHASYSQAKHTKTVIPAPPLDESGRAQAPRP